MRKPVAAIVIAFLLALAPSAGAQAGPGSDTAAASGGFIRIGGPLRLPARKVLRVPLRSTTTCNVTTRAVLVLPGPDLLPQVSSTILRPAFPKDLVLTLNGPATRALKSNIGAARLKVRARAVDSASGAIATAFKVFGFKRA
jgi:hypothetical protein